MGKSNITVGLMDRRHKWVPIRKGKFTTRYVCRVCRKRASYIHNMTGKIGSMLKKSFAPRIIKQLNDDSPFLKFFESAGTEVFQGESIVIGRHREERV